ATATVTVTGANDAPLLYPDFIYVNEAGTGNADVFAFNGVGADRDPEGARLKVVDFLGGTTKAGELGELPGGGVARLMQDGTLWFRADGDYDAMRPGEVAQVTFTYRATDGQFTRTSHVTLIIEGRNTAPVARNDHFSTDEEKVKSGWLFADNGEGADSDVDSDGWAVLEVNRSKANVGVSFDLPEGGRLRVMETGQFWFNPLDDFDHLDAGETETVSFTYTIDDQAGGYSRATVEIVVHGISYLPVIARDDVVTITENATLDFDFLKDDYENPDDAPEVVGVSFAPSGPGTYPGPDGGSLTLNPDGRSIHFDPGTDFDFLRQGQQERFEFDYEIEDRNGDRSTATVEIRVNGRNDAPVAQDDHFEWSLTSGGAMNVFADNGSGADFDADAGDALQVGGLRTGYYSQWFWGLGPLHIPGGGTATITSAGDLTLNPHSEDIEGYKGTTFEGGDLEAGDQVTLTYRLLDASGLYSDPATVIIDVIA
ncbi:MAG: Ig-like domain-containing protein, partial [Pseudomonadota bacterium]|nr:Ig-like domain-containing protein [Pseudomonadota bacterium]